MWRTFDEAGDVRRPGSARTRRQQLADLEAQFQEEVDALEVQLAPLTEEVERVVVRPRRATSTWTW
jgi:hypothetical protein